MKCGVILLMEGLWPVVTKQESDMICTAVPKQPETPVSSKAVRVENVILKTFSLTSKNLSIGMISGNLQ